MKTAQLEDTGKHVAEVVCVFTPDEAAILHKALTDYVAKNSKLRKAKKLLAAFNDAPIFF